MRTLFFGCHGPFWRDIPSRLASIRFVVRKHYAPVCQARTSAEQHETLTRQFRKHRFYDGQETVEIYVDDLLDMPSNEEILRCLTTLPAG